MNNFYVCPEQKTIQNLFFEVFELKKILGFEKK
jgi:hypothetical protein